MGALCVITVDTNSVVPGKRTSFWQESFLAFRKSAIVVERSDTAGFQGRVRVRTLGALRLVEVTASPHRAMFLPVEDSVSIHVHLKGRAILEQGRRHKQVDRGSLYLEDDRRPRRVTLGTRCRAFCISMPVRHLVERVPNWERFTLTPMRLDPALSPIFLDHVRSLRRLLADSNTPSSSDMEDPTYDLLALSLNATGSAASHAPSRLDSYHVTRIKTFIRDHLCDPALDTDFIATGVGLSARHIQRLFTAQSQHVMEWVWQERLDGCYRSLMQPAPDVRISDIAYAWGFSSSAHFSRAFRYRYGASPREVRAMAFQVPQVKNHASN
jgi:AraC family transcriptional activator of tynA and feaB